MFVYFTMLPVSSLVYVKPSDRMINELVVA
jgi:hypothetical protein